MMIFLKRTGFLLLMAVLGVLSLLLHSSGYPLAWSVYTDQAYWLPLAYGINVLFVIAVVAMIFWGVRGFLFDRGRPWLAWFSIAIWVVVWVGSAWNDVSRRTPIWTAGLFVGSHALNERAKVLEQQDWSVEELQKFPDVQRKQICTNAILKEESRMVVKREGIPVDLSFPKEFADKGLFNANACPSELVQQYQKLKELEAKIAAVLSEKDYGVADLKAVNAISSMAAQAGLLAHPDAVVRMAEIYKAFKDDPVGRKVAFAEFQLQLYTNGQVREHEWEEMNGESDKEIAKISIDPRIWEESDKDGADAWNYWMKHEYVSGKSKLVMATIDCKKRTIQVSLVIEKNADGQMKLSHILAEKSHIDRGTWAERWLQTVCSSKDKQARMSEEIANKKVGD